MAKKKNSKDYIDNQKFYEAMVDYKGKLNLAKSEGKALPQIPNYIGQCIFLIANRLSTKPSFIGYCVDEESQALSKNGWVNYNNIKIGDDILSYDIKTNKLVWGKLKHLNIFDYDGLLFKITSSSIDGMVTPSHKFVTKENGLIEIEKIRAKDHIITMGDPLEINEKTYDDEFVEIVGWYVTEGSCLKYTKSNGEISNYCSIYQSNIKNHENCERIERCLKNLIIDYENKRKEENDGMKSFNLGVDLSKKVLKVAPNKVLSSEFIISLTMEQRELLIQTMLKADGHNLQYFQKDKDHIDSFIMLCVLSGYNTHLSEYKEWKTRFGLSKGYTVTLSHKNYCYMEKVNLYGGKRKAGGNWLENEHKPTFYYKGKVWCPTTEYGTFVCRRKSRVYVTGNSYRDDMVSDGILTCIKYLDNFDETKYTNPFAYFTMIIWRSFLNRIAQEKKQQYVKYKLMEKQMLSNDLVDIGDDDFFSNVDLNNEVMNKVIDNFEEKMNNVAMKAKKSKINEFLE